MLVSGDEILRKATEGKYGVAAYNFVNMEILQVIIQAANEEKSPLIIATSEGAIKYMGDSYVKAFIDVVRSDAQVPVAFHLDHGQSLDMVKRVIGLGYTSVMIDASKYDFEKNIAITKEVVEYAHQHGVSVEAELGTIGGVEDNIEAKEIIFTDPAKAKEFAERTGCDSLAVAIGTSHGAYKFKGKAELHFDVLDQIRSAVSIPLVLHGASSIPDEAVDRINQFGGEMEHTHGVDGDVLQEAVRRGIAKVNTDSDLRLIWTGSVRQVLAEKKSEFDPRNIIGPARGLILEYIKSRMRLLGSSGKG
ncbi:MAG: class II fructose-1,6-bisphosphate aldolase [Candidatus Woesearchaeota archaeon]